MFFRSKAKIKVHYELFKFHCLLGMLFGLRAYLLNREHYLLPLSHKEALRSLLFLQGSSSFPVCFQLFTKGLHFFGVVTNYRGRFEGLPQTVCKFCDIRILGCENVIRY